MRRGFACHSEESATLVGERRRVSHCVESAQSEIPHSALDRTVQGSAPSKVTPFPRKRESNFPGAEVDPRFRGGDECHDFHHYGWAPGSFTLGMTANFKAGEW